MRIIVLAFILVISNQVRSTPADSVRMEQRNGKYYVIHEVEEKETLYGVARRYGSSVSEVVKANGILNNSIDIGQVLSIPIQQEIVDEPIQQPTKDNSSDSTAIHIVQKGETLYSISRAYRLTVDELKKMNSLETNTLALGDKLLVSSQEGAKSVAPTATEKKELDKSLEGFETYQVQTGETLRMISGKLGNTTDSLRLWNSLKSDYLEIGQKLLYKAVSDTIVSSTQSKNEDRVETDEKGFERIYEQGVAAVIEDIRTKKFLALHRSLPIGTKLEVRNIMNNKVVHVKVVGKLPDTGLNKDLLVRLSEKAFDQLGILDKKSQVEISYYKK